MCFIAVMLTEKLLSCVIVLNGGVVPPFLASGLSCAASETT